MIEMTEKVLDILRRQSKRIYCVSDGDLFEKIPSSSIEFLLEQIQLPNGHSDLVCKLEYIVHIGWLLIQEYYKNKDSDDW